MVFVIVAATPEVCIYDNIIFESSALIAQVFCRLEIPIKSWLMEFLCTQLLRIAMEKLQLLAL